MTLARMQLNHRNAAALRLPLRRACAPGTVRSGTRSFTSASAFSTTTSIDVTWKIRVTGMAFLPQQKPND